MPPLLHHHLCAMKRYLLLFVSLIQLVVRAQPVSFEPHPDLLSPVTGFTLYADCTVDMNDDLLDDVVRIGNKGIYIDFQQQDGTFRQKFFSVVIQAPPDWSIAAGDIDNDGYNDLFFGHGGPVSFLRAIGHGQSYEEAVMPVSILSQRSTFVDINTDGWLDAFVCNDTARNIPFRNLGYGEMIPDTTLIRTSGRPGNYAAFWTDYDLDQDIDLYISKCEVGAFPGDVDRTNLLYRNDGQGLFTEVAHAAGVDDNAQSWCTVFEDFDNDGDFDAFVVNHDFQNRLYRNNGDGTFTDVIGSSGINPLDLVATENASGDFNNDGYMDILAEMEQELYLGHGDLTFTGQDAPVSMGAISDLNGDGFLDVYHKNQSWLNTGNANHYVNIQPLGITSNRNGIGTRVELFGDWGRQVREVRSGQSYSPMSSMTVHFGLGANDHIDSVRLFWPSGLITTLSDLQADTVYRIPEAVCVLPEVQLAESGVLPLCPGDSVTLHAPQGFDHYTWSDGAEGQTYKAVQPGTYYALCTNTDGCLALTHLVQIEWRGDTLPHVYSPEGNTICKGDSLTLYASPGSNPVWSTGDADTSALTVHEKGLYTVTVDAVCADGPLTSLPFAVHVLEVTPPEAIGAEIVAGDSVLLSAEGVQCAWYDAPVGGQLLGTGNTFQTGPLTTSTIFYVESHQVYPGEIQMGGKTDTAGTGGVATQAGFLRFEAWEPFTLESVTVYIPEGGSLATRFVQLWSGDSVLAFKSFVMHPGANVLELGFTILPGAYSLRCQQGLLWRNTGDLHYPYAIGDVGAITSSSFGDGYYYFFYDWHIGTPDYSCISERTHVPVIITDTHNPNYAAAIKIFPNPGKEVWYVENPSADSEVKEIHVMDMHGRELQKLVLRPATIQEIDISSWPAGVYILVVQGASFRYVCRAVKW